MESFGGGGVEEAGQVEASVEVELPASGACTFQGTYVSTVLRPSSRALRSRSAH